MKECENKCLKKEDLLQSEKEAWKSQAELKENILIKIWQDRHACKAKHQERILEISDNKESIALLKQSHKTMTENLKEIKKDMKEGFSNFEDKLEDFLKTFPDHFATKEEHVNNSKRIESLEKWVWWIIWIVATWIMWAILRLILI